LSKATGKAVSKYTELGSVAEINPSSIGKDYSFTEIEYIDISAVGTGSLSTTNSIELSYAPSRAKRLVKDGDTILSTVRPNRRSFLFIKGSTPRTVVSTGFAVIRPKDNIDPRYLYYSVTNQAFTDYLTVNAKGAAYPAVDTDTIARGVIYYPRKEVQQKIASILSAYDDLIENNTRRIRILEEMAQSLYREWFVHFRFPGHEKVKLVNSPLGKIPEGWDVARLGDLAQETRRSVSPDQIDPKTPYIGLEHLPRKSIALSEWGTANQVKSTKLAFTKGEILFGKIRPYFHKVGVAPVDGVCSSDIIVISTKDPEFYSIVLACVSSEEFVSHATQTSQGTKMPRANWKVLLDYPLLVPPDSIRSEFNNVLENVVDQIENMIFKNINLRHTRDLLLPKMVSGQIDIREIIARKTGR